MKFKTERQAIITMINDVINRLENGHLVEGLKRLKEYERMISKLEKESPSPASE